MTVDKDPQRFWNSLEKEGDQLMLLNLHYLHQTAKLNIRSIFRFYCFFVCLFVVFNSTVFDDLALSSFNQ